MKNENMDMPKMSNELEKDLFDQYVWFWSHESKQTDRSISKVEECDSSSDNNND